MLDKFSLEMVYHTNSFVHNIKCLQLFQILQNISQYE